MGSEAVMGSFTLRGWPLYASAVELPSELFSFAKLKRCRVMDVLRLVATSTARDGTISGPVVVLTPDGAVRCALHAEVSPSSRGRPRPARLREAAS